MSMWGYPFSVTELMRRAQELDRMHTAQENQRLRDLNERKRQERAQRRQEPRRRITDAIPDQWDALDDEDPYGALNEDVW